jgi:hypothetical protein
MYTVCSIPDAPLTPATCVFLQMIPMQVLPPGMAHGSMVPGMAAWPFLMQQQLQMMSGQLSPLMQTVSTVTSTVLPAAAAEEYPERAGERDCTFYLKTGKCKFGATCRYNHPRDRQGAAERAGIVSEELNNLGLPIREVSSAPRAATTTPGTARAPRRGRGS